MLLRSFTLTRRVRVVQRALRLESRPSARLQQNWTSLLNSIEDDSRPIVVTANNTPHFSIVAVNDAWVELCGFSHSEAIGKSLSLIQGPSTDRLVAREATRSLATSRTRGNITFELVNYTKDRRAFVNNVHVSPVDVAMGDGNMASLFVGALSFKEWHVPEGKAVFPVKAQAVPAETAHFSLAQSLALSSNSAPARPSRLAGATATYNLDRLRSGVAF